MDFEKTNNWLSLLANIAVLFGIAALIYELDQNTTAIENETVWSRTASGMDTYSFLIDSATLWDSLLFVSGMSADEFEAALASRDPEVFRAIREAQSFWGAVLLQQESRFLTQPENVEQNKFEIQTRLGAPRVQNYVRSRLGNHSAEFATFVEQAFSEMN